MRLAQLVSLTNGRVTIPHAFARVLGLANDSVIFASLVSDHGDGSLRGKEWIITTIPPPCWNRVRLVTVRLPGKVGALNSLAEGLASRAINILLMEGYRRANQYRSQSMAAAPVDTEVDAWWSAVVELPKATSIARGTADLEAVCRDFVAQAWKELGPLSTTSVSHGFMITAGDGDRDRRLLAELLPMKLAALAETVPGEPQACRLVHSSSGFHLSRLPDLERHERHPRCLLMTNTEERYLRLVQLDERSLFEVDLDCASTPPPGGGVLAAVTQRLRELGLNLIYVSNFLTSRTERVESAHIRLFAVFDRTSSGRSPGGLQPPTPAQILRNITSARRSGDPSSIILKARLRLHKSDSRRTYEWRTARPKSTIGGSQTEEIREIGFFAARFAVFIHRSRRRFRNRHWALVLMTSHYAWTIGALLAISLWLFKSHPEILRGPGFWLGLGTSLVGEVLSALIASRPQDAD